MVHIKKDPDCPQDPETADLSVNSTNFRKMTV